MKNQEKTNPEVLKIVDLLFSKYSKVLLNKQETAFLVGCSISTLDRLRKIGRGVEFVQETDTSNVYYSIYSIAQWLSQNKIKTV